MLTIKPISLFNSVRVLTVLLLIGLLMPTGPALAQTPSYITETFNKYQPVNGAEDQPPSLLLKWNSDSTIASYEYCIDTIDNDTCDVAWESADTADFAAVNLAENTPYYWQIRAIDKSNVLYSDGNVWWSFTTGAKALLSRVASPNRSVPLMSENKKSAVESDVVSLASGNMVQDPSFESSFGSEAYWIQYSSEFGTPLCITEACGTGGGTAGPRSGSAWVWFGGTDAAEDAQIVQPIFFPACTATLQFYLWIGAAGPGSDAADVFTVAIDGTSVVFRADATQTWAYPTYTLVSLDISSFANNATHLLTFNSHTTNQIVNFSLDDVSLVFGSCPISGNVGVGDATLSYTDGTPKTVKAWPSGSYSVPVSYNWSGTVTPTHQCFNFSPTNKLYNNVSNAQTSQNYIPTLKPTSGCGDINVSIGGTQRGRFGVPAQGSTRTSFASLDNGPVKIASTNGATLIASERINLLHHASVESYAEVMGLPATKLTDTYLFPWYNNVGLDSQLRFGNVGSANTVVTVKIGGVERGTYPLTPNQSVRVSYPTVDSGPVEIKSSGGVPIIASERINLLNHPSVASYAEVMGLSASSVAGTKYMFPWYNNVGLDSQLRFGNVGSANTVVTVKIGGTVRGSYPLEPSQSTRISFPGIDAGPVEVESSDGVPIIASERINLLHHATVASYAEIMGLSGTTLTHTKYVFPWYNNVGLDSQLRFANVGSANTTVTVTIGGTERGSYVLGPNQSTRISFPGVDAGPVVVESSGGVPIIASERINLLHHPTVSSYAEIMGLSVGAPLGLPGNQLSDTYWFPWYNNVGLDSQLRFGVP